MDKRQFNRGMPCAAFLLTCCFVLGCAGKPPSSPSAVKKVPVSGTVTLGGKPLADAEVYFFTQKFTGFAKTNDDGNYILAQGAAIGANKVYISKLEGGSAVAAVNDPALALDDPTQTEIANQAQRSTGKKGPKQLIPPQFSSEKTTKLTLDVPEGGVKDANFNL
jgi:hypothetical protein